MERNTGPIIEELSSSDDEFFDTKTEPPIDPPKADPHKGSSELDELLKERMKQQKNDVSDDVVLTPEEIEARTKRAEEKKMDGNKAFVEKKFDEAVMIYTQGIEITPPKSQLKAILLGNRAACYLAVEDYKKCVEDCDKALEIDDKYVKVYQRRANAHRKLEDYRGALKDFEKVVELLKDEAPLDAKRAIRDLAPLAKKQEEEEKEKMMGQLKDLGNKFLGLFGLSVDNFKVQQDPNSGSYSINFNQGNNPAPPSNDAPPSPDTGGKN